MLRKRFPVAIFSHKLHLEVLELRLAPAVYGPALPSSFPPPAGQIITVDATANVHAINQNIYGTAFASSAQLLDLNAPLNRSGGNATTRYNWQANASNRAADYYFESIQDSTGSTPGASNESGDGFVNTTKAGAAESMLTVPTIGWVAKVGAGGSKLASFSVAKYGQQQSTDPYFPDAGNGVHTNGTNITGNNPNDANISANAAFQQGWIQHLVQKWGSSNNGGVKYYFLDNEPSIWQSTHRDVHPTGAMMDEIFNDAVAYSNAIKATDPNAKVLGPEEWGWSGYFLSGYDQQWGSIHGWNQHPDKDAHGGMDYLPWYLNQIHQYDMAHGTKLIDAFTLHFYPQGGEFSNDTSTSTQQLRNRSTRGLWDPNYVNESWIGSAGPDGGKVQLIPRMKNWVNTYDPGIQVGLTEYNWGAEGHMNGATTQADILGILGREGADLATRWTTPTTNSPTYLAMKMFRNYDGNKSTFGDLSVLDTAGDPDNVSSFASVRSADGTLTIMVINKTVYTAASPTTSVTVNLNNFSSQGTAQVWQLAAGNPNIQTSASISHLSNINVTNNSFTFSAPDQSVTLFVLPAFVSTNTTLTSSANPAALGTAITLTAQVTASFGTPTGTVNFFDGNNQIGTGMLNASGIATMSTSTLSAGNHNLQARYVATGNFTNSNSGPLNQQIVAPPTVTSVQIENGAAQRSMVRQLTVTFSTVVTLDTDALTITFKGTSTTVSSSVSTSTVNGVTVATITFPTGAGKSIGDGRYILTTDATKVHETSALHLGMSANRTDEFFRLFGDYNGDARVDFIDFAFFRNALGSQAGDANYVDFFDFNNDGRVDFLDFAQFRSRLGTTI